MNYADELRDIISGDVMTDEKTLAEHSRDASLFVVEPEVVVFPRDAKDVEKIVDFVAKRKKQQPSLSISARSGGTCMSGGSLNESIVLGFTKYFNQTPIVNPSANVAISQPGVYYRNFEKETLKHNLLLPSYPASREICAIGGMVNNNSGGEKTLRYGKTIDYVEELRVVFADGKERTVKPLTEKELKKKMAGRDFEATVYKKLYNLITKNYEVIHDARPKVSKNSAGYNLWDVWDEEKRVFDLPKLFVSAQGTLGIVTETTFRLIKPDRHSQMMTVFLKNLDNLGDIVNIVLEHKPTTFESYDDKTLKLALKFAKELIARLGKENFWRIVRNSLTEFWAVLTKGFPRLVLQITFEGDDRDELRDQAVELKRRLKEFKPQYMEVIKTDEEAQQYWLIRRESFNLLRHKIKDKKTAPFVDDIVVDPKKLPEFLPLLNNILDEYDITYTVAGHIGNGNFHIIPLMDLAKEEQRQIIPDLSRRVYDLVLKFGGSITGEHNDGLIRTPYLEQMFGSDVYTLFKETKKIFDPLGIFNPLKKVNGDLKYALEHIRRE